MQSIFSNDVILSASGFEDMWRNHAFHGLGPPMRVNRLFFGLGTQDFKSKAHAIIAYLGSVLGATLVACQVFCERAYVR